MDELKHKVLGFLNKQQLGNTKIPSMGFQDEVYSHNNAGRNNSAIPEAMLSINSKTVTDELRPDDQLILDSIRKIYFNQDPNFCASKYILQKLPEDTLDGSKFADEEKNLKVQHQCVSKRLLNMIQQQQAAWAEQFRNVDILQTDLENSLRVCRESRAHLNLAKTQFVSSLVVLANYRKRQNLKKLMHSLTAIKMLYSTDERIQALLREGNYHTAILLLNESISVAALYPHVHCVTALALKFKDTLELSEEQLDNALAQICYNFDEVTYGRLQSAYKKLGKGQLAIDKLSMHFTSAVNNSALQVLHKYTTINESSSDVAPHKKLYKELCQCVASQEVLPCLMELCESMWVLVSSYHKTTLWHASSEDKFADLEASLLTQSLRSVMPDCIKSPPVADFEDNQTKNYVREKLENGSTKIWFDVQSKVSIFLLNTSLANFPFEHFVHILSILHRLIQIGEEFCDSQSGDLQESIRKQSVNYLYTYHSTRLEELRIFFENEMWELCPVKPNFEITQLQEFRSLRNTLKHHKSGVPCTPKHDMCSNNSQDGSSSLANYFVRFDAENTPFQLQLDESLVEENFLSDIEDEPGTGYSTESDSENEEVRLDFVDENQPFRSPGEVVVKPQIEKSPVRSLLLTNTTLSVLRQIGKYLQMSRLLQPISMDIFVCLTQLFEYYIYAVNACFTSDLSIAGGSLYTIILNSVLKRISEQLILPRIYTESPSNESAAMGSINEHLELTTLKVQRPELNSIVCLSNPENLFGLAARIVAVESSIFLAQQFEYLKNYLEFLVPAEKAHTISLFYNQTISATKDLRKPVYMAVASLSFDLRQTLQSMAKVNWEIKDVMSQHNGYINALLRDVQTFAMRFEKIEQKMHIPVEVYTSVWECVAHVITHTLVEGFSNAKKCSNGGRGLMQLDFTQFMSMFEKITNIKPMPHREYVILYIKAFYLPENSLELFIKEHTEYSAKHMYGLVMCVCHANKKTRQRLCGVIEEIERNR